MRSSGRIAGAGVAERLRGIVESGGERFRGGFRCILEAAGAGSA
jgi:hypothetical protein